MELVNVAEDSFGIVKTVERKEKMSRYFVSYIPFNKAYVEVDGSNVIVQSIIEEMNNDFWTEVDWLSYWLYRIFE